ncbi:MAG: hypothetical protein GWP36_08920 [Bacteroidetes bacterium]|nr:hypothetical protein [Bacteroidota bacterium]
MSPYSHFELSLDSGGVAWITMDVTGKSVNILSHEVSNELIMLIDGLAANPPSGLVFQSGKSRGFIFGADVNEFANFKTRAEVEEHIRPVLQCFQQIEDMPCPTVILIDGICVGGGLELAFAFDHIVGIDSPSCQVGFPEVNLGILPGYGGSARACARMGLEAAVKLVLSGKPLKARDALAVGAIDHIVVDRDALVGAARDVMAGKIDRKSPIKPPVEQDDAAGIIAAERAVIAKRMLPENLPAPFAILDHYSDDDLSQNNLLAKETSLFSDLILTPASVGLRRSFQLNDAVKKGSRGDAQIRHIHVVGAGVMGGAIASVAAMSGFAVALQDLSPEVIDKAIARSKALYERRLKDPAKVAATLARLKADPEGDGLATADLMIEAVAENLDIKKKVFAAAEARMKPEAILATNTSAIPLEDIGAALNAPERLIGMHFFNPVPVLPLVEIIYTEASRADFVDRAMYASGAMKKLPIRCKSSPGFLVNRALLPYLFHAIEAVLNGADPDKLDQALVRFGMPMGPIELCDQVGLDVCHDSGMVIGMPKDVEMKLKSMLQAGTLGRKSGSGFYAWDDKKAIRPRASYDAAELAEIADQLLAPLVKECRDAIAENVVDSAEMADAACIFGIGFPSFRGGPVFWDEAKSV